jgi:hypothetical protein
MADTSVGLKCDVKKIFDKDLTKAVLAQIKETIEASVNGAKGLKFDEKAKSGWLLTATVTSLELDDDTLSIKISIDGVAFGGSASGFSANGNRKVSGINTKKIESEVPTLVNDAFENLMKSKVIKVLQDN